MSEKQTVTKKIEISEEPKPLSPKPTHHSLPDIDLTDEIQDMEAIRSLLFGKQTKAINETINTLEKRFDKVARGHAYRIATLEQEANKPELQNRINEFSLKLSKLEDQLLRGTKTFKEEIKKADHRSEVLIFEQIKILSEATLKDFDDLREELRGEIANLKEQTEKNSQVGKALINLGKQLQIEAKPERSSQDDGSK